MLLFTLWCSGWVKFIKGIKSDHCLLKASAVERAGRKTKILVNDKEREIKIKYQESNGICRN